MPEDATAGSWRAKLFAGIDVALAHGQRAAEDRMMGQSGLFAAAVNETSTGEVFTDVAAWGQDEVARREKAAVGFYLSAHPLDNYKTILSGMRLRDISEFQNLEADQTVKLAGMISGLQVRTSKRGNRFAQFRFEDRSGGLKGVLLGENFNKLSHLLVDDGLFIAEGNIKVEEGGSTFMISEMRSLYEAEALQARTIDVAVSEADLEPRFLEDLYRLLERDRGHCRVALSIAAGRARVHLSAGELSIAPSRQLQKDLEARGCVVSWVQ